MIYFSSDNPMDALFNMFLYCSMLSWMEIIILTLHKVMLTL